MTFHWTSLQRQARVHRLFRADEIITILKTGTYPFEFPYVPREQLASQRRYPSAEVVNVQPESSTERFDVTDERNRFEIRLFIKLLRTDDAELQDLADIERQILLQLDAATTLADKQIILEEKTWNRGNIRDNPYKVHGLQSVLTVVILEKKSTSGLGSIGGNTFISISSVAELQNIPIIDRPNETSIETVENLVNTARERKGVATINETHTFFAKMEYTKTRWDKLHQVKSAKTTISFSVIRGVDTQARNGRLTNISNGTVGIDNIETILFQIEIF